MTRRRQIGAIERERAGAVRLDWSAVGKLAKKLVDRFEPCGPGDQGLAPAGGDPIGIKVEDAAGEKRVVAVTYAPAPSDAPYLVAGHARRVKTKDGKVLDFVQVEPRADACAMRSLWEQQMNSLLAHELTHVADPGVGKRKRNIPKKIETRAEFCAYVRDPGELKAHINEVRAELISLQGRRDAHHLRKAGKIKTPADNLEVSGRWQEIKGCLGEKEKRRFYKMAALATREETK